MWPALAKKKSSLVSGFLPWAQETLVTLYWINCFGTGLRQLSTWYNDPETTSSDFTPWHYVVINRHFLRSLKCCNYRYSASQETTAPSGDPNASKFQRYRNKLKLISIFLSFVNPLLDVYPPHNQSTLFYLLLLLPELCRCMILFHLSSFSSVCLAFLFLFLVAIQALCPSIIFSSGDMPGPSPFWLLDFSQNVCNACLLCDVRASYFVYNTELCNLSIINI